MKKQFRYLSVSLLLTFSIIEANGSANLNNNSLSDTYIVNIRIDFSEKQGELKRIWRFFGCDEPNYAYMKNGRKLMSKLGKMLPQQVFFRTHNLLNSGDGTPALKWGSTNVYSEDDRGNPVFNWAILDTIFDTYIKNGVKPYVEIGFMPEELSINPVPYRHNWDPAQKYNNIYTGWAYPPKDYKKWEELVYNWAKHCVDRYGKEEVEKWYWETWNEPNIGYWKGTREEFFRLHDHAVNGVLRALPSAKVGGPDVAGYGGEFMKVFIDHCLSGTNYATGKKGTPLHFVSFHAKGNPEFRDGHVSMNMSNQLKEIDNGFRLISSYPEIKNIPVVIGESDPEGCAACQGNRLGYRNGTMYSSYIAASFMRKHELAKKYEINLEGALTWAFEFEDQPYFAGFRSLATNGIDKPVLSTFRMFSKMKGDRVKVSSSSEVPLDEIIQKSVKNNPDVSALASFDGRILYILLWHYHDDDLPGKTSSIALSLENLPINWGKAIFNCFLLDKSHGNSYSKWLEMGSPQNLLKGQYKKLEESSQLKETKNWKSFHFSQAKADLKFDLERQAVMLLIVKLKK